MAEDFEVRMQDLKAQVAKPSPARVYDAILGGKNNYRIDRDFAERQMRRMPGLRQAMMANRRWLGRGVRYALGQGVTQFVDIGSGLPTMGNVHEVADAAAPGQATVVYIDNEPIALAHSTILLERDADVSRHCALAGNFHDARQLWERVLAKGVTDPTEPICLIVAAMLHFMPPESRPEEALDFYRDVLPPGSLLMISHGADGARGITEVIKDYQRTSAGGAWLRTPEEIRAFFGNFELVDPGLVWAPLWHPDEDTEPIDPPEESAYLVGIGRKP